MTDGRFDVDEYLVARLIASQFPQWAHLPVHAVPLSGWGACFNSFGRSCEPTRSC